MPKVDLDDCIERVLRLELLGEELIHDLCERLKDVLLNESSVHHIAAPVTVVGDVHGQFFDVLELFKVGGFVPDTNYLFLGDFVDRGHHGVETISLLTCLKLRYPSRVTLLRGNHETREISQIYGFYTECNRKYGNANVWKYFTDMFDFLTISVVIENSIFCVHGGLSPALQTLDQIRVIDRFQEIPHDGPLADLMWSDPDADKEEYSPSPRGAGFTFGRTVVNKFLQANSMTHILRAHQLCDEGYQVLFEDKLSTVWSAPNYCYRCGNKASILEISETLERKFNMFQESSRSVLVDDTVPDVQKQLPEYFL